MEPLVAPVESTYVQIPLEPTLQGPTVAVVNNKVLVILQAVEVANVGVIVVGVRVLGLLLGEREGDRVGDFGVGLLLGERDGDRVGDFDVGARVGARVGACVLVGERDGTVVGRADGRSVGRRVGDVDGDVVIGTAHSH